MSNTTSPYENLSGPAAIEKIKHVTEESDTCFFSTRVHANTHSRPMTIQEIDPEGNIWFLSDINSDKNHEISSDSEVELYFMNTAKNEYIFIKGKATLFQDKSLIEKHWNNFANAWFNGKEDPNLTVIKVIPDNAYYYETKESKLVAGNSTENNNVEGTLEI